MTKNSDVQEFVRDLKVLFRIPVKKSYQSLVVPGAAFDGQLLSMSRIYRKSRSFYLNLSGTFRPRVCSTIRSLVSQDLFRDQIDFSPIADELEWFVHSSHELADPAFSQKALLSFNEISLFHEQNHRVLWRLLPPAPKAEADFCRYLNFAESLVVTLDLVLGDELGYQHSNLFEKRKVIYRPGAKENFIRKSKKIYRNYLFALFFASYLVLELVDSRDLTKALDYVLLGQKKMNQLAVARALELSELFSRVTNPEWQSRYWKVAQKKLSILQKGFPEEALILPKDPLDFDAEFAIVERVLKYYDL